MWVQVKPGVWKKQCGRNIYEVVLLEEGAVGWLLLPGGRALPLGLPPPVLWPPAQERQKPETGR